MRALWLFAQGSAVLEVLLILVFLGLVLASKKKMGFANPFQLYFGVWFALLLGYYLSQDSFIPVPPEFLLLMIVAKAFAFVLLVGVYLGAPSNSTSKLLDGLPVPKNRLLLLVQILTLIAAPFVYLRAVSIAGGDDIFTVLGYIKLRSAMSEDGESFGVLSYFSILSFVATSIAVGSYFERRRGGWRLLGSILISSFYVYISTGRTFVLLFFVLLALPLVLAGIMRVKGIVIALVLVACSFVFVAAMTAKGVSFEADAAENANSFLIGLRGYTVAPFLALSRLTTNLVTPDLGLNTFRSFFSILNAIGITDIAPKALVRDYEFVPDPTNVYTVYDAYFRDFFYFGFLIPPAFLIGHWWLYRRAKNNGGRWIYYYAASVYPLAMQFFQDQYFSLLSMWIQVGFWYWLLLNSHGNLKKGQIRD